MNDVLKQHVWSQFETAQPRQRIVLLGASNLKLSFPIVVETAWQMFDAPLAFEVAMGHGRSYGQEAGCFGKKISGIFQNKIWDDLRSQKQLPTVGFLTDIGNDLAYEIPVEMILQWVRRCVDRLLEVEARVMIGALPIESLREVSERKFGLFRRVLFPACSLSWGELLSRAEQLNERLHSLAELQEIPIFSVENEFYGFDPIHPRKRHYAAIWRQMFGHFATRQRAESSACSSWLVRQYLGCLSSPTTTNGWLFARRESYQVRLHCGSTITLY